MPWTIDDTRAKFKEGLTPSALRKWEAFFALVQDGMHPRDAAERSGDMNYRLLQGSVNQFEIRLSQGNRATFFVFEAMQRVEVRQVGGHT